MVFDYIDGGADDEHTLRANVERFRAHRLTWRALQDVSQLSTATTVLGSASALPFILSPTAAQRLFDPTAGEVAAARAAAAAGIIYSISTLATTSIETAAAAASGPKWFQLYVWKDRGLARELLRRARAAGYTAAILTVDVPVAGNRERDLRNDFTVPPRVSFRTMAQALARPAYLWRMWTSPRMQPENIVHTMPSIGGGVMRFLDSQIDHTLGWKDIEWMIDEWGGPLAIKGVTTPADAEQCVRVGARGVWISNHGGRQLDTAPATIDVLEPIVQQVADRAEVILDGGIRRGTDIIKALALGARAVAIGRAFLYGLAAGGEAGVARAIELLAAELRRDLALMGCTDVRKISRDCVLPPL